MSNNQVSIEKNLVYGALEARMLAFEDIVPIPVEDNGEPLVALRPNKSLRINLSRIEMQPFTGNALYVRQTVATMLGIVGMSLYRLNSQYQLDIGYGYRPLSVQRKNFEKEKARLCEVVPQDQLDAAAHRQVAMPEIAGHPTGAAVDVQIISRGVALDFGTKLWEFSKDSYTDSPYITARQSDNRALLRGVMTAVGFAPFEGEWWHFSYGDKEWAAYTNQPKALYQQIEFSA